MSNPLISLDPRITRLGVYEVTPETLVSKSPLDQFETYEAFFQKKVEGPYEHTGPVHAPHPELAYLFAKEQYSRRGNTCTGIAVVKTEDIQATAFTDNDKNIYDLILPRGEIDLSGPVKSFDIFHMKKRGQQHEHVGRVEAHSAEEAIYKAKQEFSALAPVVNVWVAATEDIRFSTPEEKSFWDTLPLKKYREPLAYKVQGKIDQYKQEHSAN